jgi:hypothetical protein
MAEDEPKTEAEQSEQKISDSLEKIIFVPHDVGAPEVTDAGGVRSIAQAPKLLGLAPDSVARSLSPSPTLYWYLSKDTETPVRFTLQTDTPHSAPLLELDLGAPAGPEIYAIALADHGVQLESKRRYDWSLSISSADGASAGESIAQASLEHSPSSELGSTLEAISPFDQTVRLARAGYWYDACDVVSRQIEDGEQSLPWHRIRARLLDQVGLKEAATFDRRQMGR